MTSLLLPLIRCTPEQQLHELEISLKQLILICRFDASIIASAHVERGRREKNTNGEFLFKCRSLCLSSWIKMKAFSIHNQGDLNTTRFGFVSCSVFYSFSRWLMVSSNADVLTNNKFGFIKVLIGKNCLMRLKNPTWRWKIVQWMKARRFNRACIRDFKSVEKKTRVING